MADHPVPNAEESDGGGSPVALTDEQIAWMTQAQRRDLMVRLARAGTGATPLPGLDLRRFRRHRLTVLTISTAALVPWTVHLGQTLPDHYLTSHWSLAWAGFDVILMLMFLSTVVAGLCRRQVVVLFALVSGVLLLCDAWFDATTANVHDRPSSLAMAVLTEAPLALLLIVGALRLLRATMTATLALEEGDRLWRARLGPSYESVPMD